MLKMAKRHRTSSTDIKSHLKRSKFEIDHVPLVSLARSGLVLVTGSGDVGQLGLGPDLFEKSRFALVPVDRDIVDICAGGMHTICLIKNGKVITFGCNDEGALGRITANQEDGEFVPGEVELPGKVVQITAGDSHSAALLEDGRVFAWGSFRDSHGNMGLTPTGNETLPYEIIRDHIIVKIASGADHIIFLTSHGEVYTCGCAEQGQLGRTTERGSGRTARSSGGINQISKLLIPSLITVNPRLKLRFEDIWTGTYASFCKVAGRDTLYVFGLNNYNQLGLKGTEPQFIPKISQEFSQHKWRSISGAQHHTIGVDVNGITFAIGRKEYGRLGLGDTCEDANTLIKIPGLQDKKVVDVSSGPSSSFAVTEEGELYSWGMGGGHLGIGELDEDRCEPTLVKGKQLNDKQILRVRGGGQHTVILATVINNNQVNGEPNNVET